MKNGGHSGAPPSTAIIGKAMLDRPILYAVPRTSILGAILLTGILGALLQVKFASMIPC